MVLALSEKGEGGGVVLALSEKWRKFWAALDRFECVGVKERGREGGRSL